MLTLEYDFIDHELLVFEIYIVYQRKHAKKMHAWSWNKVQRILLSLLFISECSFELQPIRYIYSCIVNVT